MPDVLSLTDLQPFLQPPGALVEVLASTGQSVVSTGPDILLVSGASAESRALRWPKLQCEYATHPSVYPSQSPIHAVGPTWPVLSGVVHSTFRWQCFSLLWLVRSWPEAVVFPSGSASAALVGVPALVERPCVLFAQTAFLLLHARRPISGHNPLGAASEFPDQVVAWFPGTVVPSAVFFPGVAVARLAISLLPPDL